MNTELPLNTRRPWHLWLIGTVALLWYVSGTWTILMAQAGSLPGISADEAAYYAAQPLWFVVLTDISLCSALAASLALLLQSRFALWLFSLSLTTIIITNVYDLMMGTSRVFANTGALVATLVIVIIAVLLVYYTWAMTRRGVLR